MVRVVGLGGFRASGALQLLRGSVYAVTERQDSGVQRPRILARLEGLLLVDGKSGVSVLVDVCDPVNNDSV